MPLKLYSDDLADRICERIARGESLVEICRADDLPSETTVYRWLAEKPVFREMYARARDRS